MRVELPCHIGPISDFLFEKQLLQAARIGLSRKALNGFFDPYELVGILYPNIHGIAAPRAYETAPLDALLGRSIGRSTFRMSANRIFGNGLRVTRTLGVSRRVSGACSDLIPRGILEHATSRPCFDAPSLAQLAYEMRPAPPTSDTFLAAGTFLWKL